MTVHTAQHGSDPEALKLPSARCLSHSGLHNGRQPTQQPFGPPNLCLAHSSLPCDGATHALTTLYCAWKDPGQAMPSRLDQHAVKRARLAVPQVSSPGGESRQMLSLGPSTMQIPTHVTHTCMDAMHTCTDQKQRGTESPQKAVWLEDNFFQHAGAQGSSESQEPEQARGAHNPQPQLAEHRMGSDRPQLQNTQKAANADDSQLQLPEALMLDQEYWDEEAAPSETRLPDQDRSMTLGEAMQLLEQVLPNQASPQQTALPDQASPLHQTPVPAAKHLVSCSAQHSNFPFTSQASQADVEVGFSFMCRLTLF